jgi:hypothetical protein
VCPCQENRKQKYNVKDLSVTNKRYVRFLAQDLSGLLMSPREVTDEADRDATGEPEDAL